MNKRLKVGVFGGGRGAALIQVLLHHPDAELVNRMQVDAIGRNWTHLDANWYILGLKNDLLKPV